MWLRESDRLQDRNEEFDIVALYHGLQMQASGVSECGHWSWKNDVRRGKQ